MFATTILESIYSEAGDPKTPPKTMSYPKEATHYNEMN
jgi:hypothetical protein